MAAVELMRVFMLMDSVFILMAIGHTHRQIKRALHSLVDKAIRIEKIT